MGEGGVFPIAGFVALISSTCIGVAGICLCDGMPHLAVTEVQLGNPLFPRVHYYISIMVVKGEHDCGYMVTSSIYSCYTSAVSTVH